MHGHAHHRTGGASRPLRGTGTHCAAPTHTSANKSLLGTAGIIMHVRVLVRALQAVQAR